MFDRFTLSDSGMCVSLCYRTNVVLNYTEIEAKVREATNDEAWGPTGMIIQFNNTSRVQIIFVFFIYVI